MAEVAHPLLVRLEILAGRPEIGAGVLAKMAAVAAGRAVGAKLGLREIRIHLCQRSPGSQGVR